jgi:hypothetical protein
MKKIAPALLIIILISLAIGASTLRRGHEWVDDFAWYILQAKSIWEGTIDLWAVLTNYQSTTHLGCHPPGIPFDITFYAVMDQPLY